MLRLFSFPLKLAPTRKAGHILFHCKVAFKFCHILKGLALNLNLRSRLCSPSHIRGIEGIDGLVNFEGESVSELTKAFHEAVGDYLAYCTEEGIDPHKS